MSRAPRTRQSLLLELGRHSDAAWVEFLAIYENAIFRFCRSLGLQEADARDATQDVLAVVHQRIPTWDLSSSEGSFRGWLFRVARNISVDVISERAKAAGAQGGVQDEHVLAELAAPAETRQAAFEIELRRSLFEWAANQVRSEVRDVTWRSFQMTALQGLKAEQAAAELGVSTGSVYTAKCRVVARIRERIALVGDEFPSGVHAPPDA